MKPKSLTFRIFINTFFVGTLIYFICAFLFISNMYGYFEKQIFSENEDKMVVYITETGIVYHKDSHCTYLEPSVRAVPADGLEALRNQDGGKYYLCEHCGRYGQAQGVYYITEYGDRYHTTAMCSGLKRKIYAVPIEEAKGKGACSKCGR